MFNQERASLQEAIEIIYIKHNVPPAMRRLDIYTLLGGYTDLPELTNLAIEAAMANFLLSTNLEF